MSYSKKDNPVIRSEEETTMEQRIKSDERYSHFGKMTTALMARIACEQVARDRKEWVRKIREKANAIYIECRPSSAVNELRELAVEMEGDQDV